MAKKKRLKRQTVIHKKLHRKLKIEQHEYLQKSGVNIECSSSKLYHPDSARFILYINISYLQFLTNV